jgi:hypothetical protein
MNSLMTTLLRLPRISSLVLCLALVGLFPKPLHAQDFKVNIGGADSEQAKTEKELADKLPADQAAAYLKNRRVWSTIGETAQWLAAVALPVGIVAIVLAFRHRRQKLAHETMRLMIEKGLPVPTELINRQHGTMRQFIITFPSFRAPSPGTLPALSRRSQGSPRAAPSR